MAINISTIRIKSDPEKIWGALTKPELVKKWQYGSNLITDWVVGNEIKFETVWEGKIFKQWGKILEVIPNKLIKYSLFAPSPGLEDKPENYFFMQYVLTDEGNGFTNLEIIQEDNRPGAVAEETQEENPVLKELKSLIEK
jgi:uncharacterized protein YndB with AHSA1/START domain